MDYDALMKDRLDALMDAEHLNKINNVLKKLEDTAKDELVDLGKAPDLNSKDAENFLIGYTPDKNEKDRRKAEESDKIATKYLALQNISWIRAAIKDGQLLQAILFSLDAVVTFMVADYASGMKSRKNGEKAGKANADNSHAFYKQLIKRDDELKLERRGRSKNWRAKQIATELAAGQIELVLPEEYDRKPKESAVKKGIEKARKN